jgi:HD-GYP domain-containing protein (c-di-GMP phosphodiesterase class II)
MRRQLFRFYASMAAVYLVAIDRLTAVICTVLIFLNEWNKKLSAAFNIKMLEAIHPESMREANTEIEKMQQRHEAEMASIELKLIKAVHQVRDHARASQDWTEQHSDAVEAVGNALIEECGWEEGDVHQLIKEAVESIDGLEYGL